MTTSNNPVLTTTADDIVKDAYAELNLYGVDENIPSPDYQLALRKLNRMIKTWMAKAYHVWLKRTAYLFVKKGQREYILSSSSPDHATLEDFRTSVSNYSTTLSTDAVATDTSVDLTDVSDIAVSDYIGIVLNDNDIYWSIVDSIVSNTITFQIGDSLPSDADSGRTVYHYTTKLANPFNVYAGLRHQNGRDIPMYPPLSYDEYFELPNKDDTASTPTSFNYDRQLNQTIIRLWPIPDRSDIIIKFIISRNIDIFETNTNEPDFNMEWYEALVLNLATSLASSFGRNIGDQYANLKNDAMAALDDALSFDNEPGSIYFQPDFH